MFRNLYLRNVIFEQCPHCGALVYKVRGENIVVDTHFQYGKFEIIRVGYCRHTDIELYKWEVPIDSGNRLRFVRSSHVS